MAYTFSTQKNGIVVTTTLHGTPTPEQIQKARVEATHRVEQLQPAGIKFDREDRRPDRRGPREDAAVWDGAYQSTGR